MGVWAYMIAFKNASELWYSNQAITDLEIHDRIVDTISGESPLRYFDGATMQTLSHPSRVSEITFCRSEIKDPYCEAGHGYDPERPNADISTFEVRESQVSGAGRGVFFKEDTPKESYVAIDAGVHTLLVHPDTRRIVKQMGRVDERWKIWDAYLFGYGFSNDFFGDAAFMVDASPLTFINHGCNSTNNLNNIYSVNEMTADPHRMPREIAENVMESYVYNPFIDRNHLNLFHEANLNRDVKAQEELLDNYLDYLHDDNWLWGVVNYRAMCQASGARAGVVTAYGNRDEQQVEY